eukprot:scaffold546_cov352-Prasinococcus_capsulatus_cf.AAC.18
MVPAFLLRTLRTRTCRRVAWPTREPTHDDRCSIRRRGPARRGTHLHLVQGALFRGAVPMHDDAVVRLVDEVRAAADVVQVGWGAGPLLHMATDPPGRQLRACTSAGGEGSTLT